MRFRLRTLMIVLAIGPLVLAVAIFYLALHGFIPGIGVTSNGEIKASQGESMLRFTTRDLLWLMMVVGLGCALAASVIDRRSMQEQLGDLNRSIERHERNEMIFKRELKRLTGQHVSGWSIWSDESAPNGFRSSVDYLRD